MSSCLKPLSQKETERGGGRWEWDKMNRGGGRMRGKKAE